MEIEDSIWYHVVYTTGTKIGTTEIGIDCDLFIPSLVVEHIKERDNFDYCAIINWKRIESAAISDDTREKFEKKWGKQ